MAVQISTNAYFAKSFAPVSAFPFSVSWVGRLTAGIALTRSWFNMLTASAGYVVQMDGGEVQYVFDAESYNGPYNPDLTADSNWHWFTAVFTASNTYWYVDGSLVASFGHTQAIQTITALEIGGDSTTAQDGTIEIYDLRIHTSQWGLTEHQAFYNSGSGDGAVSVDSGNLSLHYKLVDNTDPTPEDVAGTHALTFSSGSATTVSSPYAFGAPEMQVTGNSVEIADGDATPSSGDHTDFGSVVVGNTQDRTFTINNTGTVNLTLDGSPKVAVGGTHAADFSVTSQPSSPVAASGNTTFTVRFTPSTTGVRSATLSIDNDDADEDPYNFSIQGTGTVVEMDVEGNSTEIADGDTTPSASDHTDFGVVETSVGTQDRTFTINNTGAATLNLTGNPIVAISGAGASHFSVTEQPASTVAGSGSDTFTVRFAPTATGTHTATLTIANDDSDENPYNFDIQGEGAAAPTVDAGDATSHTAGLLLTLAPTVVAGTGSITTYLWEVDSAPSGGTATFSNTAIEAPNVGFDLAGTYVLKLTVTDDNALSKNDTVTITVAIGAGSDPLSGGMRRAI